MKCRYISNAYPILIHCLPLNYRNSNYSFRAAPVSLNQGFCEQSIEKSMKKLSMRILTQSKLSSKKRVGLSVCLSQTSHLCLGRRVSLFVIGWFSVYGFNQLGKTLDVYKRWCQKWSIKCTLDECNFMVTKMWSELQHKKSIKELSFEPVVLKSKLSIYIAQGKFPIW